MAERQRMIKESRKYIGDLVIRVPPLALAEGEGA